MDCIDMWDDFFNEYYENNFVSMCFWFSSNCMGLMGILMLILHTSTFQIFPELETNAMAFLTVCPLLNMCSCSLFKSHPTTSSFNFNRRWMLSEIWELIGISFINVANSDSFQNKYLHILCLEITGYLFYIMSVIVDFNFSENEASATEEIYYSFPKIEIKTDLIYLTDCFGLFLLVIVSIGNYYINRSTVINRNLKSI